MSMPRKPGLESMQQNTSEISVNRSLVEHNLQEFGSFMVGLLGSLKNSLDTWWFHTICDVQEYAISGALPHGDDGVLIPGLCPSLFEAVPIVQRVL